MRIVSLTVLAALAFSTAANATNSGQLDVTVTDVTTAEAIDTANDQSVFALDQLLVVTGIGVLNNTTARCLALEVAENATGASTTSGFCTFVDAAGDKIFEEFEISRDSLNGEASGTGRHSPAGPASTRASAARSPTPARCCCRARRRACSPASAASPAR